MNFFGDTQTNWKYILIVVILVILVGGGILGYTQHFRKEIISLSKFPEIKKPEKIVEDETANWETYRNTKYNYEVKYPKDSIYGVYEELLPKYWEVRFKPPPLQGHFSIEVLEDEIYPSPERRHPTFEDFISSQQEWYLTNCSKGECSFKEIEIKLNRFNGVQYQAVFRRLSEITGEVYYAILITTYISKDNDVFIIEFSGPYMEMAEIPSEYLKTYNQMLSTFRFLE